MSLFSTASIVSIFFDLRGSSGSTGCNADRQSGGPDDGVQRQHPSASDGIEGDDDPGELLVDFLNVVEYLLGFHLLLGLRLPNIFYFSPEFIDSVFQILLLERALLNIVFELETVRELVIAEEPEIDEDAQKFPDPERIQRKLGKYGKH